MATKIQNKALLDTLKEQTGMSKDTAEKFRKNVGLEKHGTMSPKSALDRSRELYKAAKEGGYKMKKGLSKTEMEMGRAIYDKAYAQAKEQAKAAPGMKPKNAKPERINLSAPQTNSGPGIGIAQNQNAAISINGSQSVGAKTSMAQTGAGAKPQISIGMPKT